MIFDFFQFKSVYEQQLIHSGIEIFIHMLFKVSGRTLLCSLIIENTEMFAEASQPTNQSCFH